MRLLLYIIPFLLLGCSVHNYDRSINIGLLDVVEDNKAVTGIENVNDIRISYSTRKLGLNTIYAKNLIKSLKITEAKTIQKEYIVLELALKDKISLIEKLNTSRLKKYLIIKPKSELITGISFLCKKEELENFKRSEKLTLSIVEGLTQLTLFEKGKRIKKSISNLLILDTTTSSICFREKGFLNYEIIDINKELSDRCLNPKKIKLKNEIYEGL